MSSRALRKAQKQREEEENLRRLQEEAESLEESEEDEPSVQPQRSAFALLNDQDDEEHESDLGGESDHKSSDDAPQQNSEPEVNIPSKNTTKKKKKKKAKAKAKSTPQGQDSGSVDDIDAALKSLATTSKTSEAEAHETIDPDLVEACKLLSIDSQNLHAENEMRRLFGRAAMEATDEDEQQQTGQGRRRNRQQMGGLAAALGRRQGAQPGGRASGLGLLGLRRNLFVQGKEEWPVGTSGGLGMEIVEKRPDGTVEYRFVHNSAYQDVQADFDVCVRSMDPERMIRLLQMNPYHISTLLQVSEIAKQERDHTTSGDLLERALFSFGRALHSTFAPTLAAGKARLSFLRPENREFFLAASRYMANLSMRATWRTVYEWARLLLALDPAADPYRMCLCIDQYALRARQPQSLLSLAANPVVAASWPALPGMQLSLALAHVQSGAPQKGKQALFAAANRSPWAVAPLLSALGLDAPPGIWGAAPRSDWETLVARLYAARAKDLWAPPEAQGLLVEVAAAVSGAVKPAPPAEREISLDEGRYVLLADVPELIALLPRSISGRLTSAGDPLPPEGEVRSYVLRSAGESRGPAVRRGGADPGMELRGIAALFDRLGPAMRALLAEEDRGQVSDQDVDRALQGSGVTRAEFEAGIARFEELITSGRVGDTNTREQEEERES